MEYHGLNKNIFYEFFCLQNIKFVSRSFALKMYISLTTSSAIYIPIIFQIRACNLYWFN